MNLKFEECTISTKAMIVFRDWMSKKSLIENLEIQKITFQDPMNDFKKLMDSIS